MQRGKGRSWRGLYTLGLVVAGLLYADARVHMGQTVRMVVLAAIVIAVCGVVWYWTERHADLMGSQGVDAQAEVHWLAARGVEPGNLAPSLTERQALYRIQMLAHKADAAERTQDH